MKRKFLLFFCLWGIWGCSPSADRQNVFPASEKIAVGVFEGHGGAQTCIWETVAALRIDPQMEVRVITSSDIACGIIDSLEAIVCLLYTSFFIIKMRTVSMKYEEQISR